jgi:hypothetical protein
MSKFSSIEPTTLTALTVYVPKCTAPETFGIIIEYLPDFGSISNLKPSVVVNTLPPNNQLIFPFG